MNFKDKEQKALRYFKNNPQALVYNKHSQNNKEIFWYSKRKKVGFEKQFDKDFNIIYLYNFFGDIKFINIICK